MTKLKFRNKLPLVAPMMLAGLAAVGFGGRAHADNVQAKAQPVNATQNMQVQNSNIKTASATASNGSVNTGSQEASVQPSTNSSNSSSSSTNNVNGSDTVLNWGAKHTDPAKLANVDVQYQDDGGHVVGSTQELNTQVGEPVTIHNGGTVTTNGQQTKMPAGYMVADPVSFPQSENAQRGFNPAVIPVQRQTNVDQDVGNLLDTVPGAGVPVGDPSPNDSPGNVPNGPQSKGGGSGNTPSFKWPSSMAFMGFGSFYHPGGPVHQKIRSRKSFGKAGMYDSSDKGHLIAFCRAASKNTPWTVERKGSAVNKLIWNILVAGFPYKGSAETATQQCVWTALGETGLDGVSGASAIWKKAKSAKGKLPAPNGSFSVQNYDIGDTTQSVVAVADGGGSGTSTSGSGKGGKGGCGGGAAAAAAAAAAAGGGTAAGGAGGATDGTAGGVTGGGNGNNNADEAGPNNLVIPSSPSQNDNNNNPANNNLVPNGPIINNNDHGDSMPKYPDRADLIAELAAMTSRENQDENTNLANLADIEKNDDLNRTQQRDSWTTNISKNLARRYDTLANDLQQYEHGGSNQSTLSAYQSAAAAQSMKTSLADSAEVSSLEASLNAQNMSAPASNGNSGNDISEQFENAANQIFGSVKSKRHHKSSGSANQVMDEFRNAVKGLNY